MNWRLSHQQVVAYLGGEADPETRQAIAKLRQDLPVYGIFFELLDALTAVDTEKNDSFDEQITPEFYIIEKGLLEYFSHKLAPSTVQQFRAGLLNSAIFYQKLLIKLSQIVPGEKSPSIPKLSETVERTRTDTELIEQIKILYPPPSVRFNKGESSRESAPGSSSFKAFPWIYSSAAVILLTLGISWLLFFHHDSRESPFAAYRWEQQVPYPPLSLNLDNSFPMTRSPSGLPETNPEMYQQYLNNLLYIAMGTYQQRNYKETINTLSIGKSLVDGMREALLHKRESSGDPQSIEGLPGLLQNYYFYLGVSHLAYSTVLKNGVAGTAQQQHLSKAIEVLRQAGELSETYTLATDQREDFFLGLAWGMLGDRESAAAALQKISRNSHFYDEAVKLLNSLRSD